MFGFSPKNQGHRLKRDFIGTTGNILRKDVYGTVNKSHKSQIQTINNELKILKAYKPKASGVEIDLINMIVEDLNSFKNNNPISVIGKLKKDIDHNNLDSTFIDYWEAVYGENLRNNSTSKGRYQLYNSDLLESISDVHKSYKGFKK